MTRIERLLTRMTRIESINDEALKGLMTRIDRINDED